MTGAADPAAGAAGSGRLAQVLASRGGKAAPEAAFVIEHREALVYMLCEAAALEHGIVSQYLFAAFSLKQRDDEGLTRSSSGRSRAGASSSHTSPPRKCSTSRWCTTCSPPSGAHLARPNLPAAAHHYPAGVNLTPVPFGAAALQHFMSLERPEDMALEEQRASTRRSKTPSR
jgi:hypothetical protein